MSGNYNFTQEELDTLRLTFEAIDKDHNGFLDHEELKIFLRQCGLDQRFSLAIFKVFDTNNDNQLSYDEFLNYLHSCAKSEEDPRYLFKLIFDSIDVDKSRTLSIDEVVEFVKLCGVDMNEEDAKAEIEAIDSDKNGAIDFEELCDALHL